MPVSFSKDIQPMFREVDIDHMRIHGVYLDSYEYMSNARTTTRMPKPSGIPSRVERCLLVVHSGRRSNLIYTTSGGLTNISPSLPGC